MNKRLFAKNNVVKHQLLSRKKLLKLGLKKLAILLRSEEIHFPNEESKVLNKLNTLQ